MTAERNRKKITFSSAPKSGSEREMSDLAGLHLSGSNSAKTSLVVLRGDLAKGPLRVAHIYDKIGSIGQLFSDDRLIHIFEGLPMLGNVFIDCPLTLPPCAACVRPKCPGVVGCDETSVAYMMSLGETLKRLSGRRRRKPINPQTQRLWDLLRVRDYPNEPIESSFSANLVPLVIRARTFERRLKSAKRDIPLKETSIPHLLALLAPVLDLSPIKIAQRYKQFEGGMELRETILDKLIELGWLEPWGNQSHRDYMSIVQSVENFQALMAAIVNGLFCVQATVDRPVDFISAEGWVYLPDVQDVQGVSKTNIVLNDIGFDPVLS